MQHFCFPDLGIEKLCSILVFGNVCFNILRVIVRMNHDNVASRGAVGRTHTIVRLQTRIRRKDGTENFGVSYLYWIWSSSTTFTAYCCFPGMSLQRVFVLWVSVCSVNLKSLFRLPRRGLLRPTDTLRLPRRGLPRLFVASKSGCPDCPAV